MKIKYLILTALFSVIAIAAQAQPLQMQWAHGLYSSQTSFTTLGVGFVEADENGNVYVVGGFQGTVDLDPSSAVANISSSRVGFGGGNSFIAKYDASGKYLFGFALDAQVLSVKIVANGNFYLVGAFDTIVDFDPSSSVSTLDGRVDENVYVAKYNSLGVFQSVYKTVGIPDISFRRAELDSKNDLYIYGTFRDTIDFDPSAGTNELISKSTGSDIFLAKYSDKNELLYAFNINSNSGSFIHNLFIDQQDQVYITGNYSPRSGDLPLDLDPGSNNTNFAGFGGVDGFWAKYSSEGAYLKGHLYHGIVRFLRVDKNNNIHIVGTSTDQMDVDISASEVLLDTDGGTADQYFVKYNASYDLVYGMTFRTTTRKMRFENMQVDDNENVYLCGEFSDTIGFVKTSSEGDVIAKGARDAFLAKFDKSGDFKFAHSFGYENFEEVNALSLDGKGNVWVAGKFTDSINLDPAGVSMSIIKEGTGGAMFFGKYLDPMAVGIKQIKESDITIYTANGNVVIDLSKQDLKNANIKVVGMNGQEYQSIENSNSDLVQIPLAELPQRQVLIVLVNSKDGALSKKIFIPSN